MRTGEGFGWNHAQRRPPWAELPMTGSGASLPLIKSFVCVHWEGRGEGSQGKPSPRTPNQGWG